jgi:GT2 family glycosyltransferase
MASQLPVSVVVPHYEDLQHLELCLTALERQTFPREQFEIVISDNASPVGEAAVANVIAGRAKLVVTHARGAGPTRNGGVSASTGAILAFTDSDCVPEPQWLQEGIDALSRFDFVGGQMKVLVDDPGQLTSAEAFERAFAFDNEAYVRDKKFTVTANLFCPRALFEKVGGFRVGVSEDVEWCHRAVAAGYRLGYAPKAAVGHPARRSWAELRKKWQRMSAEQFALQSQGRGGKLVWLARTFALPLSAVVHTPRALFSPKLSSIGQRVQATSMLYRVRLWRFADGVRLFAGGR